MDTAPSTDDLDPEARRVYWGVRFLAVAIPLTLSLILGTVIGLVLRVLFL